MPSIPTWPRDELPTMTETVDSMPVARAFSPADRGILTQTGGLEAGRVCSLGTTEVTLGRAVDCTHSFDDGSQSRVHAKITHDHGAFIVEDLASSNGTFVNEERVLRAPLEEGARLRLGATTLRFQRVTAEEESALKKVYESSVRDGLTGAVNRKHLEERLSSEVAFAVRHSSELAVVLFDLDHFKRVNDVHGHLVGDEVLRTAVAVLKQGLRAEDLLARYGGEELVVVARGIQIAGAARLADRLRASVAASEVHGAGGIVRVTMSAGVATLSCIEGTPTPVKLLGLADERLYRAKAEGRDRVVWTTK
jgi:diguanylate cyclase (GGDEF)-like protein